MTDLFLGYPDEEITNWIKDIWPLTFPIYFEFLEDGYIKLSGSTSGKYSIELLYSFDNKTWLDWDYGTRIDVIAGRKFYIKAKSENLSFCNHEDSYMRFDTDSTKVNVAGNIMSLLYNDFVDKKELKTKMCFYNLFGSCYGLTDASNLILPATTLIDYCYYRLFATDIDFTSLLKAPKELPATTLATGCYRSMFYQCQYLTTIPTLPATVLTRDCYAYMFNSCYDISSKIELPATTLANYCYYYLFHETDCEPGREFKIPEIHYPKSLQTDTTFINMDGAPWFGATNATIYYDL